MKCRVFLVHGRSGAPAARLSATIDSEDADA
jgi:hypothetical protein